MSCKILGLIICTSGRFDQIAETHFWWICAVFNLARKEVRVFGKEGVHVPGEGVLLIKGVTCDMARNGVNYFGRRTMRKASS